MKLLRNILLFLCVLVIAFSSVSPALAVETENKDPVLTTRKDFVWGLNMHSNFYAVYGTDKLEEQVHLAAEMGCKILRNNFDVNDLYHVDTFVKLCNAYGIQVMLTYEGNIKSSGSESQLEEDRTMFKMIANRYNGKNGNGKIDYIQLENELDVYFAQRVASYGGNFGNGDSISNYPQDDIERVCRNLKNASAAIREADSDVRIVINGGWKHYGMFDYFKNNGLDYDVIGWDWYTDQSSAYLSGGNTAFGIYDTLNERFHKPIIICETNIWTTRQLDEDNPATWDGLVKICEDAYSKANVIGCIFYQMCDQMNFEKDSYEPEAHFGFIYADKFGNMTGKKAAYDRFQYICGGVTQPKITIESLNNAEETDDEPSKPSKPTKPSKNKNIKNSNKKEQASPTPSDDTPYDGSAFDQTSSNISFEKTPEIEDISDNPIEQTPVISDTKPIRKYHKGNNSKGFVWTLENTLTVVVGVVTAGVIVWLVMWYIKLRKRIKALSRL